jgi:hypothetical protein
MATQKQLNSYVRRHGYGICNEVKTDPAVTTITIKHRPYGLKADSGKFYPGLTYAKYRGAHYQSAWTVIVTPSMDALDAATKKEGKK